MPRGGRRAPEGRKIRPAPALRCYHGSYCHKTSGEPVGIRYALEEVLIIFEGDLPAFFDPLRDGQPETQGFTPPRFRT